MNTLWGEITKIESHQHLSLVQVTVAQCLLQALLIETPETATYLKTGNRIEILFKETEVFIANADLHGQLSVANQLPCVVVAITQGKLLSKIALNFAQHNITSIITTQALQQLKLTVGQQVTAMVKTNELMFAS